MPAFDVTIQEKSYHVEIPSLAARPLQVIVDGQAFEVCINSAQGVPAPEAIRPAAAEASRVPPASAPQPVGPATAPAALRPASCGASAITAPMPGTVLSVEVKQGQKVDAGAILCYLEAMKMKNPIRTPLAGAVADVCVQVGQSVAYGQPLFHIDQGV